MDRPTRQPRDAGNPRPDFVAIYDTINVAYEAAAAAIRPGIAAEAVDAIGRDVIAAAGHGEHFLHRIGHGLGCDAHEKPYLVHGNESPLAVGMVFSVEPGIYVPGRWGVRIENIHTVTPDGTRLLGQTHRNLVVMG